MGNNSSALLIIDVQIGLVDLMSAEVQSSALPKIKTLLTEARASGIPVIYIQHDGAEGHPLEIDTDPGNCAHFCVSVQGFTPCGSQLVRLNP